MVNLTGYTQRHYPEKQKTKVGNSGSHWKLKDRNVAVVNLIFIIFLDSTKLEIVWIKIITFFKRRVSIIL